MAEQCDDCVPAGSSDAFLVLLDLIIECATDLLDRVGDDLERINRALFQHHATAKRRLRIEASPRRRTHQLDLILTELGYSREVLVKLRRSVLSFRRVIILLQERDAESALAVKLKSFEHELKALAEAEEDLSATNAFMLDGAVGYIGILQSRVINSGQRLRNELQAHAGTRLVLGLCLGAGVDGGLSDPSCTSSFGCGGGF